MMPPGGDGRARPWHRGRVLDLTAARILARSGLLRPTRPDRLLGMALAVARWGVTPATGYAAGAARHPDRVALIDDDGPLTWRDVDCRTDRIAGELSARGVRDGDVAGLLARNGRGFVEAAVALAKCGADVIYLNTGSSAPQLAEILDREQAQTLVHDPGFADAVGPAARGRRVLTTAEVDGWAAAPGPGAPPKPSHTSRQVILTSGTTGAPRGAARGGASVDDAVAVLSSLPMRAGETTVIAAPLFHAWGLGHLSLGLLLGSTAVVTERFDAARVLALVQEHLATALVVVPVMLDRLLEADPSRYDLSSLRVIATSGSALPGDLASRTLAAFGPVLYNLYGSTEVAYAAVAGPEDLTADPTTAGRPPHGVTLRVVDDDGADVPVGEVGRIFVGSGLAFAGYTDGSDKDRLGDLVSTGDLGRMDPNGRLTVLGRSDDMVVVGGENVMLGAVEDALLRHHLVADAAVVGEQHASFGIMLVAFVVASGAVTEQELKDHVGGLLARYAVPREVHLVDALPRNATGKVVRRELFR